MSWISLIQITVSCLWIRPQTRVSFTSDRNKPPKTLQIVMRTDEISVDDDTAKTADAEVEKAKESPLVGCGMCLVQMWKAMVSIFKNR